MLELLVLQKACITNPIEITRSNWIVGSYLDTKESVYYELHYCKSNHYLTGFLIDDVWSQSFYDINAQKKVDIYIVSGSSELSSNFFLNEKYCYFLQTKSIEKKFFKYEELNTDEKLVIDSIVSLCLTKYSSDCREQNKPVLSIVTTVFNNSLLLEQTIQSVINQECCSFEYIIKDAKSRDNFEEVIARYTKYNIKVIRAKDKGIYDGMDQGIRAAEGEYVQILNSDDLFKSSIVVSEYVNAICSTNGDAYCSDINIVFPDGRSMIRKADLSKLRYRSCINHTSLALKKSDYINVGGFDLNLRIAADCDLTIKLVDAGLNIKHLDLVCVNFRAEGTSNSTYSFRMLKENLICRYRYSALNIQGYLFTILQFLKLKLQNR